MIIPVLYGEFSEFAGGSETSAGVVWGTAGTGTVCANTGSGAAGVLDTAVLDTAGAAAAGVVFAAVAGAW